MASRLLGEVPEIQSMKHEQRSSGFSAEAGRHLRGLAGAVSIAGFSVLAPLVATGCVATLGTDAEYAEADDVPPDITVYPHTYYEGRDVYLVNDRYYYRGPDQHWVYYRHAPAPLVERRSSFVRERPYVQQAPVVRRAPVVRHAPARRHEEQRVRPGVRSPEPATQVR
jgi:hypothetical protein